MNNYFATVGTSDNNDSYEKTACHNMPDTTERDPEFEFEQVSIQEVKRLVQDIDINKSSSIEHLNSRILKCAFTILLTQIVHLFNCSLGTNIYPDSWKTGKIIPIPKNKDIMHVTNWRPISLLSLPGKLLEKLVHKQLYHH